MPTINDAFINAILADAAYVDDSLGLDENDLALQLENRMAPGLAKFIADNFEAISQDDNTPEVGTGFDAVIWQGRPDSGYAGQTYVSLRGGRDIKEDLDLAFSGLTHDQLADMVNWWLRETTPKGDEAQQITVRTLLLVESFISAPSVEGNGTLDTTTLNGVNGHSLGGYLAASFARIFGNKCAIDSLRT